MHARLRGEIGSDKPFDGRCGTILFAMIHFLVQVLPPTIHPMVVHFPIAFLFLTAVVDLLGYLNEDEGHFFARVSFWLLTGSLFALFAAAVAGVVSEQSVKWTPVTAAILSAHQHDAVLTGLFASAAWLLRLNRRYKKHDFGWSVLGTRRGRPGLLATLLTIAAVVMVSITGSLGGSMVYNHGVGIVGVTRGVSHTTSPGSGR